jgi:putative PIN family toxin of toxin-antitoxin system
MKHTHETSGIPRIVIDTNTVLDMLVFEDPTAQDLLAQLQCGDLQWLAAAPMREELVRVLGYPQIAKRLQARAMAPEAVLAAFDSLVVLKPVAARAAFVCKDRDDQQFIDLALAWQAALLSKDRAVLSMTRRMARLGILVSASWTALQGQLLMASVSDATVATAPKNANGVCN